MPALMIGTAANHGRDNLDFRRGSTVMVGHLKRSRNVGSGASHPKTQFAAIRRLFCADKSSSMPE